MQKSIYTVAKSCDADGATIELSASERNTLGIKHGDIIEIIVSAITHALQVTTKRGGVQHIPIKGIVPGAKVEIRVPKTESIKRIKKLAIRFKAENDPEHNERSCTIKEKIPKYDGNRYLVLPKTIVKQLHLDTADEKSCKSSIGTALVRINKMEVRIPIVTDGNEFGITTETSKHFGIKETVAKISIGIIEGKLILALD